MTRKSFVFRYFADFRDAGTRAMCPPKRFDEFSEARALAGLSVFGAQLRRNQGARQLTPQTWLVAML
jgi:hypothetical protein